MPERAPKGADPSRRKSARPKRGLAKEYAALEATLSGTPLGRWFLAEYMRRNRAPETQLMLDAITRLEAAVLKPRSQAGLVSVLGELVEISDAIARTRQEIAQMRHPDGVDTDLLNATEELDQIIESTEKATSEILSAAEDIQEAAWTLREKGADAELCDKLDRRAIDIYTACSFQDITGQRTGKVMRILRLIEQRIDAVIEVWGIEDVARRVGKAAGRAETDEAALLNGPQSQGEGLKQNDVDQLLTREQSAAQRPEPSEKAQAPRGERFERPEPLTVPQLHAVKRAALFG